MGALGRTAHGPPYRWRTATGVLPAPVGRLALDDLGHHRVADNFRAHFAEFFLEAFERHDRLGHGAMAAGTADIVIKFLHDFPGAFAVTDVAHRDDDAILDQAGDHAPFDPLDLQAELGHLRNHVFAVDLAHVN